MNSTKKTSRWAAVLLGAVTMTAGLSAVTTPAQAAGNEIQPDLQACFTEGNQPVFIQRWDAKGRAWNNTGRSANNASDGCIRFNDVVSGYHYKLVLYRTYRYGDCMTYVRGDSRDTWAERGDKLHILSSRQNRTPVYGPYYLAGKC